MLKLVFPFKQQKHLLDFNIMNIINITWQFVLEYSHNCQTHVWILHCAAKRTIITEVIKSLKVWNQSSLKSKPLLAAAATAAAFSPPMSCGNGSALNEWGGVLAARCKADEL